MQRQEKSVCWSRFILPVLSTCIALVTAGCGLSQFGANNAASPSLDGPAITGMAHGGYFPVANAAVTLWYPGVTGYGSAPTPLKSVTTDSGGNFSFPASSYTCPAADMPVYLTLTGGNPGLTTTGNWDPSTGNSYLALMAAIGPCSGAPSQVVMINEVTTVASVIATAQFTSASQAANGTSQVNSYTVSAGGNSYTDSTLTVSFSGGGCTTEPTAAVLPVTSGAVTPGTYITTSTGVGCTSAPAATLSGAGGTGALAAANYSPVGGSGSVGGSTIGSVSGTTAANGGNIGAPIGTVTGGVLTVTNQLAYTGLKNAFATVNNLVNISGGVAGASVANATVETAKLNTMANILAACVQTDGVTADSAVCSNLAALTPTGVTPTGHTVPTDTVQIATYMALSPTTNVSNVYNFSTGQSIFQTALGAAPFDWTVGISYGSLDLAAPYYLAVDTTGNIWLANRASPAGLVEVSPLGQSLSGGATFLSGTYSYGSGGSNTGLLIDARGHVWTAFTSTFNGLSDFNPATTTQTKYPAASVCSPSGLTMNANLDLLYVCAADTSTSTPPVLPLNGLQNHGTVAAPDYTAGTNTIGNTSTIGAATATTSPTQLASDPLGNIWAPIYISGSAPVAQMVPGNFSGTPSLPTSYTEITSVAGSGSSPVGVLVDHGNNVWMTNSSAWNKFSYPAYGNTHSTSALAGGMTGARFSVLDGAGDMWVGNGNGTVVNSVTYYTVSAISNAGTSITPVTTTNVNPGGYTHNYGTTPRGVATDASGNVWVPNSASTVGAVSQLTEIVGAAVPVYLPLGAAALNNRLGTLP